MGEKLPENIDIYRDNPDIPKPPELRIESEERPKTEEIDHDHSIDKLQRSIHETALSTEEHKVEQDSLGDGERPVLGMQRQLKNDAYTKGMQKVRSRLSPAQRSLSKVVHHKTIEPISEISAKTIARPSGILGSGVVALIGSGVVLYMSKHYGFQYNFTIFLILLAGGFGVGLIIELLSSWLRRNKA